MVSLADIKREKLVAVFTDATLSNADLERLFWTNLFSGSSDQLSNEDLKRGALLEQLSISGVGLSNADLARRYWRLTVGSDIISNADLEKLFWEAYALVTFTLTTELDELLLTELSEEIRT